MKVALVFLTLATAVSPLTSQLLFAQDHAAAKEPDYGYLDVLRETAEWPTPEKLVSQLRSSDAQVRLSALRLLGLTDKQAYHTAWSQTSQTKVVGEELMKPDEVRLMYAALGRDATQQAVIAILDRESAMTYAAVGVPTAKGWQRIAMLNCWCKYDMSSDQDAIGEFVQLHSAPQFNPSPTDPQRFELVIRASGGGTGVYTQNEIHFRIRGLQLADVLSFVSRHRNNCETGPSCVHLEARWFYSVPVRDKPGGLLIAAQADFPPSGAKSVDWSIRAFEVRHLHTAECQSYEWKEASFHYAPVGKGTLCPN